MKEDFKAMVTMVRNFPSHVGCYDAWLPEKQYDDQNLQSCFRDGWAHAVDAINAKLTEMQNESEE